MPAQQLPWFRFWKGATQHVKARSLSDGEFRTWIELLDLAAQQKVRGRFTDRRAAVALCRRPAVHVGALIAAGLIDEDSADGHLTMHDWDDWQRWRKEDVSDDGSPTDEPPNDSRSTRNGHTNDTRTTRDEPANNHSIDPVSRVRAAAPAAQEERVKSKELTPNGVMSESGETRAGDVEAVYAHFKARVQPKSRLCPRKKICSRLKRFSVEELKQGIDHFADDPWWMENNASRGAEWFFESDGRAEQFLLMRPRDPAKVTPIRGMIQPERRIIDRTGIAN